MHRTASLGTLLLALTSTASAEPATQGFVGAGISIGGDHFFHEAAGIEAGIQLGSLPVWARIGGDAGNAFDFEGGGGYQRVIGGLESRQCSSPSVCLVLDLGAGAQRSTWSSSDPGDMTELHQGMVLAGRIGIDAGGDHFRFRGALELVRAHDVSDAQWHAGAGVSLGLAYRM